MCICTLHVYTYMYIHMLYAATRGWRSAVGGLMEKVWLKNNYRWPQYIGMCVQNGGGRFRRIRILKEYHINSIPPTSHISRAAAEVHTHRCTFTRRAERNDLGKNRPASKRQEVIVRVSTGVAFRQSAPGACPLMKPLGDIQNPAFGSWQREAGQRGSALCSILSIQRSSPSAQVRAYDDGA